MSGYLSVFEHIVLFRHLQKLLGEHASFLLSLLILKVLV